MLRNSNDMRVAILLETGTLNNGVRTGVHLTHQLAWSTGVAGGEFANSGLFGAGKEHCWSHGESFGTLKKVGIGGVNSDTASYIPYANRAAALAVAIFSAHLISHISLSNLSNRLTFAHVA